MCQDSSDFFFLALLHQGVIQHNALILEEAIHVCIAVCAASRPINHE